MKLIKHAHACVTLEKNGRQIVLDPGTLTPDAAEAIAAAEAILITHDHFDHFDRDTIEAALNARKSLAVFGPPAVVQALGDHDGRVREVQSGDTFEVAGFTVEVFGDQHALIHADIPQIANVGYRIDASVFHPGDAYFAPGVPVQTLLLPTSGPWTKIGDAADFVRMVAPERVIQIHELMLSELGQNSAARFLGADGLTGIPFTILAPSDSIDL